MKHKPLIEAETVPGHSFEVTGEAARKRQELAEKGLNVDEILLELLQKREDEIAKEKNMIGAEPAKSRHIPARTCKLLHKEYGKICSIQTCKEHHAIAHTVNLKFQTNSMKVPNRLTS